MPSCRIFKGTPHETLTRFSFREIDSEDDPQVGAEALQGDVSSADEDPLEDLEQTIRRQLLEAERRAQEIERDAYQKGYEQGQKDGFQFGVKSMRVVQEQMEALLRHMEGLPPQILEDYREWLVRTSLSLAKIIVGQEVRADTTLLTTLVDECLEAMDRSQKITLVLHPKDKALLEKHGILARWQETQETSEGGLQIRTDTALERGGCRMISAIQEIDATLETRWRDLENHLAAHLRSESDHES